MTPLPLVINPLDPGHITHHEVLHDLVQDLTSGSTIGFRPQAADAIRFVSMDGDDTSDGLSWGSAKQTIQAALDDLPLYSAGAGGGTVYVGGDGPFAGFAYSSGQRVVGAGMRATMVRGTVAGPLISSPTGGNLVDPITAYCALENLYVLNESTSNAARAIELNQMANFTAKNVAAQCAGGHIVRCHGVILADFDHVRMGGVTGADTCMFLDGVGAANNVIRLRSCDFTDAKGGLRAVSGTGLLIESPHFEALAGGLASYNASMIVDSFRGGVLDDAYFESCAQPAIAFYAAQNVSKVWDLRRGSSILNCASPFVDVSNLQYSKIGTFYMVPGATAPNAHGVVAAGANPVANEYEEQVLASGTGTALSIGTAARHSRYDSQGVIQVMAAASANILRTQVIGEAFNRMTMRADGAILRSVAGAAGPDVIDTVGNGSPEGVVAGAPGSRYSRRDGGVGSSFYIKQTGTSTTGWLAIA